MQRRALWRKLLVAAAVIAAVVLGTQGLDSSPAKARILHLVQPGETLWDLSRRYGVPVSELLHGNPGVDPHRLRVGQSISVPVETHTIQPRDTLWGIARRAGVTVDDLVRANPHLDAYRLPVGQKVALPRKRAPRQQTTAAIAVSRASGLDPIELMARVIAAEAEGEPYEGQVAVGAVILNRLRSPDFPDTLSEVIFQPRAFESVSNGLIWRRTPRETSYRAAYDALAGRDPTGGCLYFWNPAKPVHPWMNTRTKVLQIGNHVFAK